MLLMLLMLLLVRAVLNVGAPWSGRELPLLLLQLQPVRAVAHSGPLLVLEPLCLRLLLVRLRLLQALLACLRLRRGVRLLR